MLVGVNFQENTFLPEKNIFKKKIMSNKKKVNLHKVDHA